MRTCTSPSPSTSEASPQPTIGVEWEFALVDKETRDLTNTAADLFAAVTPDPVDPKRLHKELLRNTVEVVTGICTSVGEAVADLRETLAVVVPAADELGVDLLGSGTHPFASWSAQQLTEGVRYEELINRTQWWGRQMLIWGVHVHVGLPSQDRVMPIMSSLLNTYPHLLALSASSPVWAGLDTGYASNRSQMFQQLPTAGLPFTFDTWEEFEACIGDRATTGVIDSMSDMRWDIRPAPHPGTIENRVCDGMSDITELASLTALIHCLVVDLDTRLAAGETLPDDAAVARAGEQVARRALQARRHRDPRREVPRTARHRRPRRPARAAQPGRTQARVRGRAARGRRHPAQRRVLPAPA
ncbi:glutamate--cysteine ligase [Nocardioides sp. B-3]|uniref:glutamate--cysteine ligase n=1 Tax=Nocardioides sp. B-3 TaxID=2895565 RepID=UPI0021528831|nr:glutamate--cysteine ligase [Nocardioides sp. B-3]UUZ60499.1 glutamate--cysteine ligase [Nocardioides sp. B-3]